MERTIIFCLRVNVNLGCGAWERKFDFVKMLLRVSTKYDTTVIIALFTELFEVKRNLGPRNDFFALSSWELPQQIGEIQNCP